MNRTRSFLIGCVAVSVIAAASHAQGPPEIVWTKLDGVRPGRVAFSPDGRYIAAGYGGDNNAYVALRHVSTGAIYRTLATSSHPLSIAFSPEGTLVASGCDQPYGVGREVVRIWRVSDGQLVLGIYDHLETASSVVFTPDGRQIVVGGVDTREYMSRAISFYDVPSGVRRRWFSDWTSVRGMAQSPDGSLIAGTSSSFDLRVWRSADGQVVFDVPLAGSLVTFAPDGEALAVGGTGAVVQLRRSSDGAPLSTLALYDPRPDFTGLAFSPDGGVLAATERKYRKLYLWSPSDGALLRYFDTGASPSSVTFSPDGAYMAYSDAGGLVLARNPYGPPPTPEDSAIAVGNASGRIGESVLLAAQLVCVGGPVAGRPIAFAVNGSHVGQAVTDSTGWARLQYTVPEGAGAGYRVVEAAFAGDAYFNPSQGAGLLTVQRTETFAYTIDRTGGIDTTCYLKGYLYRSTDRMRVAERSLIFRVDGSEVGSAVTEGGGAAVLAYSIPEGAGAGQRSIAVEWPGDTTYFPSQASATLTCTKGSLLIWVLQPRTARSGGSGYLRAYVRTLPDLRWKGGIAIDFFVGGTSVGSDTTNADGRATVLYAVPPGMVPGDHPLRCDFAGDAAYHPTTAGGILTVTP
ncbi:MAG: hypothetical protein GX446_07700 [Chthonomonadales bacterium]|nr:hypothetical protein [Chthonomonadales bacterium]